MRRLREEERAVILAHDGRIFVDPGGCGVEVGGAGKAIDVDEAVMFRALRITAHLDSLEPAELRRFGEQFRLKAESRAATRLASPKSIAAYCVLADVLDEAGRE